MKSWDKNGDGESLVPVRLAVNDKGLNVQGSAAEIDALFDSFDTDKGGTLDLQGSNAFSCCRTRWGRAWARSYRQA